MQDYALKIIEENSAFWKRLIAGEAEPKGIALYVIPLGRYGVGPSDHPLADHFNFRAASVPPSKPRGPAPLAVW